MSNLTLTYETKGRTAGGGEGDYRIEVYEDHERRGDALFIVHDPRGAASGVRLEAQQQRELARALLKNIEIGSGG